MSAYLVDTNVLVYAYDPTDGAKRAGGSGLAESGIKRAGRAEPPDIGRVLCDRDAKNPLSVDSGTGPAQSGQLPPLMEGIEIDGLDRFRGHPGCGTASDELLGCLGLGHGQTEPGGYGIERRFHRRDAPRRRRFHNPFVTSFEVEGAR